MAVGCTVWICTTCGLPAVSTGARVRVLVLRRVSPVNQIMTLFHICSTARVTRYRFLFPVLAVMKGRGGDGRSGLAIFY
jgi:hypothetical protein